MATIFEDTNPHDLKELLLQINSRVMALPAFQRSFVWDPAATQKLIASIASNYPAGSLLRVHITDGLFASREFEGAPSLDHHIPLYLVLDGQQRLTSLYQAFYGVGSYRYYLKIQNLLDEKAFEDSILTLRASSKEAKEYEDRVEDEEARDKALAAQARDLVLPLSALKDGRGGFDEWANRIVDVRSLTDAEKWQFSQLLTRKIANTWIQTIADYQFPVVTLSSATSEEAICTIFETLNSTGVKLSVFELLTARYWSKDVDLRHLWEQAEQQYPAIKAYEVDPYYVLQIVALSCLSAPSCRRGDVLKLTSQEVAKWWQSSVDALGEILSILMQDCGVLTADWLPYYTILLPMSAVLARLGRRAGPVVGADC